MMFQLTGVGHSYGASRVLDDITLEVQEGQILGLIGPNGSGKTTLLRTLYGAIAPEQGTVLFEGRDVRSIPTRERARSIAVVVQEGVHDLVPTVADAVLMGRTPHLRPFRRSSARDESLAAEALERVGAAHVAARGLDELSGGERQRVLVARALVQQARCLLLDEPTNHLDVGHQHQLLRLVRELGVTTVVVLHDLNLAARYCDRIAMLVGGRLEAVGEPADVLTPRLLNPVYDVAAESVIAGDGAPQLLFRGRA